MIGIVRERLARPDAAGGFVLDGFPRTVAQAEALDVLMTGRDALIVVDLAVADEVLVRRLTSRKVCGTCGANAATPNDGACGRCGGALVQRSDDREEVVRERLRVYARNTRPLLEFYGKRLTFRAVDGARAPEAVAAALAAAIDGAAGVTASAQHSAREPFR
jgi:adenylate kinase